VSFADHLQTGTIKLLGFFLRRFSLRTVQKIATSLGKFFYRYVPIRKDVALANLKLCFPEKTDEELQIILKKSYINVATVLFEFLYFPKFTRANLSETVNLPGESRRLVASALERGKGLVMISGHFSNWELVALAGGVLFPKPLTIIVHPFHNQAADKFANRYRSLLGNSTVPMANSIRASLSQLSSNGIIALLADQSAAKESAPALFFGIDVPTFQGPASFALRTHAAVQVGFVIRKDDGTYYLDLREIDYGDLRDDSEKNVRELTQRHVSALEEYIRRYPENWLWFHKRFKHVPAFQEKLREVKGG